MHLYCNKIRGTAPWRVEKWRENSSHDTWAVWQTRQVNTPLETASGRACCCCWLLPSVFPASWLSGFTRGFFKPEPEVDWLFPGPTMWQIRCVFKLPTDLKDLRHWGQRYVVTEVSCCLPPCCCWCCWTGSAEMEVTCSPLTLVACFTLWATRRWAL